MVPLRKLERTSWRVSSAATASEARNGADTLPASRPRSAAPGGASSMPRSSMLVHSALLSGVAGYVDAAAFVSLLGLFPAHLTGELVGDAIALSAGHLGERSHWWAFPVFVGAVTLASVVARVLRHHGRQARACLLALITLALTLFTISDALAWLLHEGHLPLLVRGGFAVAAMGFQSALMRESLTGSCPTTVMTGNLTQVVIEIVDRLVSKCVPHAAITARPASRLTPMASALLLFASSAVLGGWLTRAHGSLSVAVPTLLCAVLMVRAWRDEAAEPAECSTPHLLAAPVPRAPEVWPDSLDPSTADAEDATLHAPLPGEGLTSEARLKAEAAVDAARPPMKRSVSGTRPAQR